MDTKGAEALTVFAPIAAYNAGIITYFPTKELQSTIIASLLITVFLSLLAVLCAGITAFFIGRSIARPLQELARNAGQLAQGIDRHDCRYWRFRNQSTNRSSDENAN